MTKIDGEIAQNMDKRDWTYEKIGEKHDLDGEKFSEFMRQEFDRKEDPDSNVGSGEDYVYEGSNIKFVFAMMWAKKIRDSDERIDPSTEPKVGALRSFGLLEAA